VIGPTDPVMASNLTAPSCSVAEDVTEGVVVDDSVDILARCATTTPEGNLRAVRPRLLKATFVRRCLTWFQERRRNQVVIWMRFRKPPP